LVEKIQEVMKNGRGRGHSGHAEYAGPTSILERLEKSKALLFDVLSSLATQEYRINSLVKNGIIMDDRHRLMVHHATSMIERDAQKILDGLGVLGVSSDAHYSEHFTSAIGSILRLN
jgi:hypothetical protein